jgi:flagellar FliL protein
MLPAFNAAPSDSAPPAKAGKVELDLDGAPFLQEEEAPPPAPVKKEERPKAEATGEAKPKKSKKKLLILGLVGLLGCGAAAGFLFSGGDEAEPEIPPGATVITVPSTPFTGPANTDQFLIEVPAFWVEITDQAGEIRLLNCKIGIPTNNNDNVLEFNAKKLVIRDALFYYLINKDYAFLSDSQNMETLKKDMVSIINEYLTTEKIREVLLADFIIR